MSTSSRAASPRQPFSVAGRGEGSGDHVRGNIFQYIRASAASRQPRIMVLDNVKGLAAQHRRTLNTILANIRSIIDNETGDQCYEVYWDVVNTRSIGLVPQQRERLYIVAIKRMGRRAVPSTWPKPAPTLDLQDFYDTPRSAPVDYGDYPIWQVHAGDRATELEGSRGQDQGPRTRSGQIPTLSG